MSAFITLTLANKKHVAVNVAHIVRYTPNRGGAHVWCVGMSDDRPLRIREDAAQVSMLIAQALQ